MALFSKRQAFGDNEFESLNAYLRQCLVQGDDPGYDGQPTRSFAEDFEIHMGGGHALPVSSGTAACYLSLKSLDLPEGSHILVSPIADPGVISAIYLAGFQPRLVDVDENDCVISVPRIADRLNSESSGVFLIHTFGKAANAREIAEFCSSKGLALIEDCSQAHGAELTGSRVGTFGDVAAFSTMFTKTLQVGGSGGLVYTKEWATYQHLVAIADRGKPKWQKDFDPRDPTKFLGPALNFSTSDIASVIGSASLRRLSSAIERRRWYFEALRSQQEDFQPLRVLDLGSDSSPFVIPVLTPTSDTSSKLKLSQSLREAGVPHNSNYQYEVASWPWATPLLADHFRPENAHQTLRRSVMLYLNERYGPEELKVTVDALRKAASHLH